tara:strand:+ start:3544 stop:3669 length:126 start_codon:yes stop_codon:yes gene_type:complete
MDNSSSKKRDDETEILRLAKQLSELGLERALKLIQQVKEST